MDLSRLQRLLLLFITMVVLLAIGIGYFYSREHNLTDAIWMTVTVISTLGMAESSEMTKMDKMISSLLVILSVIVFTFLIANVSEMILSGQFKNYFGMKKMKDQIEKLKDHYIVCGFGRIGESIAHGLKTEKQPFVVIETLHDEVEELKSSDDILYIEGDASQDNVLLDAGIERAKGIFCSLGDDASNLLTVLNARALNPKIKIVTRISCQDLEVRFLRAGANHCVSPQSWGSRSMLLTMFNPTISEMMMHFLDKTIETGTFDEIIVPEKSKCDGKSLNESGIRQASNVNVIGIIKAKDHSMVVNPKASSVIEIGDTLICLGAPEDFKKLKTHLGY